MARNKFSLSEVIEAQYVCHVTRALHSTGVLRAIETPTTAREIAENFGLSPIILNGLLTFVARLSDIVSQQSDGRFLLGEGYYSYSQLGFRIDKQVISTQPELLNAERVLERRAPTASYDRGDLLAAAFEKIEPDSVIPALGLIRDIGARHVLDLGCGVGKLLRDLALSDKCFSGVGIDRSPRMVGVCRKKNAEAAVADRVRVIQCDIRLLAKRMGPTARDKVELLHGKDILNELVGEDGTPLVQFLTQLKRLFPGRKFVASDYFGKLLSPDVGLEYSTTLLHDVFQLLSGQGVPPKDIDGWAQLYDKAGCRLESAYRGNASGVEWFVHLLEL